MVDPVIVFSKPERPDRPLYAARLCVRGEGPVGNDPTGPKWIFDHAGDGIVLGKGDAFRATGSRLSDFGIIKGHGYTGGTALTITAHTESERSGEGIYEGLLILGESDLKAGKQANWHDGIVVSGKALTTVNKAGCRVNRFLRSRVAGCLNDAFRLENAVHCWLIDTQVDPGSAKNVPTVRIVGGDHIFLLGVNITGRIIIEGGAKNVIVDGYAQQIVVRSGCRNITLRGIIEQSLVIESDASGRCEAITAAVVNQSKTFTVR